MKIKRAGIITKILLLAIVLYAAVRLVMLHAETRSLQSQIAHSEDDETKEEIARDTLGLVKAGEKIFYDTSN